MKTQLRVLHLEDSPCDAELVRTRLAEEGFACDLVLAQNRAEFESAIAQGPFDLILSDFALPDLDGLTALSLAQEKQPRVPFILLSGTLGEEQAVESLKGGATDYVLKHRLNRLVPAVRRALNEAEALAQRKQAEEKLRHAQKLESIGQLAAGIAHEINTPTQYIGDNTRFVQEAFADLSKLMGQYEKLLRAAKENGVTAELVAQVESAAVEADVTYLSQEIPKAIHQTMQGVERVTKIVRAMKDFSHPGAEEKTSVDLNKAIESTITVAGHEWKYVAEMRTEFDRALPLVSCLPGEVNQVILNLIVNAAHAIADVVGSSANAKGVITVTTRQSGPWAEIRIRDTGSGIPENIRSRIFEPFFTTKGVGKGTGQGLAIARAVVVDKHGGTIAFETQPSQGTTFVIRLPISSAAA
ncbi:MAG TPA: ATP-binding protein, partial [Candidatus Binatia bacterium]|nr:ATP-binding protein [Candidatus Binatia bacterium]